MGDEQLEGLFAAAQSAGLVSVQAVGRMRQHLMDGTYTREHYIKLWTERLIEHGGQGGGGRGVDAAVLRPAEGGNGQRGEREDAADARGDVGDGQRGFERAATAGRETAGLEDREQEMAKMVAARESALKELGPTTPSRMSVPSDAIILRRFYTHHPVGQASAEEWGAQSWTHAQWAEKIGRIIGSYRRKVSKRAEMNGTKATEDECRRVMFDDYINKKGVDLTAWVAKWEQLGITSSSSSRAREGQMRSARSAVDPEALAMAKAKAAAEARQRRLAFLESKAASVTSCGSTRSDNPKVRVNDWVQTSPVLRTDGQAHSLQALASGQIEATELLDDLQAASEEANMQRQDELAHRQLIGARAAFARADIDGDGVVSAEDFMEWFAVEMAVPDRAGGPDRQDLLKQWQSRIVATIMEAPAVGSSGNVGVALEGFNKLRIRRLKQLDDELEQARKSSEDARKQNQSLQERIARAHALSGVTECAQPSSVKAKESTDSFDARTSDDPVPCVITELKRLQHRTATLELHNASMLQTLQVAEQLSPKLGNRPQGSKQELEPEAEPELEVELDEACAGDQDKPQLTMLPTQVHMTCHFELMLAEHSLDRAGSHDIKEHLREHSRKLASQLSRWQPMSSALAVESTAVRHMDMHHQQCLDENSHAPLRSSALRELQEHTHAHALRIAETARCSPKAATAIVVRFEEPGPIGVTLSSEHPFDAVWKQVDANGDGKLNRREVLNVLRVMRRIDETWDVSTVDRCTTQVMNELDPTGKSLIDIHKFQRWYQTQQSRELARARVESCDVAAARQGLQRGFYLLSVNGADVRDKTIQGVTNLVRASARPLTMEFGLPDGAHPSPIPPTRLCTGGSAMPDYVPSSFKVAPPAADTSLAVHIPAKPKLRTKTLIFVKDRDLGLVLGSKDPLDQVWSQMDPDGDGVVGRDEILELWSRMGRAASEQEILNAMVEMKTDVALRRMSAGINAETGTDSFDEIDIEILENWYARQPERNLDTSGQKTPVYVESASEYAATRGLQNSVKIVSVQGRDMREMPLRQVQQAIKVGCASVKAGKPMRIVVERLDSDQVLSPQAQPQSPVQANPLSSPQAKPPSPASTLQKPVHSKPPSPKQLKSASATQAESQPSGRLVTVTLKKDKSHQGSSLGSYGMTLSPKLAVLSLPKTVLAKKSKIGPAEKAGVQIGFVLVSINGDGVVSLTDVASKFSAVHGTAVKCTFRQPSSSRAPSPIHVSAGDCLKDANCTVIVGGLDTYFPPRDESLTEHTKQHCEAELRQMFRRFGTIRSCNVRLRREVEHVGGSAHVKTSWALISFSQPAEAQFAVREHRKMHVAEWPHLTVRLVDKHIANSSTGAMAQILAEKLHGKAALSPRQETPEDENLASPRLCILSC